MSRRDQLTNRGPLFGSQRSHAMNESKRRWNLNLQNIKFLDDDGNVVKAKISARTVRTLRKHNRLISQYKKTISE